MKRLFSLPFLVENYLADTEHLTLEEHGAYCLLLFHMWREQGSLPDDPDYLARKLRIHKNKWLALRSRLLPFLQFYGPESGQRMTQKRLQEQYNYAANNHARAASKASKAATTKWERHRLLQAICAPGNAPSTASSTAQCNASAVPYLREDITTTFLEPTREGADERELVYERDEQAPARQAKPNKLIEAAMRAKANGRRLTSKG